MRKKILAVVLCLMTAVAFMPVFSFADTGSTYVRDTGFQNNSTYVITVGAGDEVYPLVAGPADESESFWGFIKKADQPIKIKELSESTTELDSDWQWTYNNGRLMNGSKCFYLASQGLKWQSQSPYRNIAFENGMLTGDSGFSDYSGATIVGTYTGDIFSTAKYDPATGIAESDGFSNFVIENSFQIFRKVSDSPWGNPEKELLAAKDAANEALNQLADSYVAPEKATVDAKVEVAKNAIRDIKDPTKVADVSAIAEQTKTEVAELKLPTKEDHATVAAYGVAVKIKSAKAGKKKIKVKFKRVGKNYKKFDGLQIQVYKSGKLVKVKNVKKSAKKATVKGLKKGKNTVKVVGFKKFNGKAVYGKASNSKTKKVK